MDVDKYKRIAVMEGISAAMGIPGPSELIDRAIQQGRKWKKPIGQHTPDDEARLAAADAKRLRKRAKILADGVLPVVQRKPLVEDNSIESKST